MNSLQNCLNYIKWSLALFLVIISCSCVTQKNLEYVQGDDSDIQSFEEALIEDYRLQPKDELYIKVTSLDDPSAQIFSSNNSSGYLENVSIQPYGASLFSYVIDKEGNITLPVLGDINVKDKTTKEVSDIILSSVVKILNQPAVSVKLVNRNVTVIGEVQRPGQYNYTLDKFTVYDAIGLAGDITIWGDRNKVVIIRNQNGKNLRIPISLTDQNILASNDLYVHPNDIIYVKPMRKRFWAINEFPYAILISTITAGILFYSVIE
ncbi:MAG: polysaccharide export protein [Bacteroidales bacterium]|nr:polysaccharide export protein [Bacteroidales bacterium]